MRTTALRRPRSARDPLTTRLLRQLAFTICAALLVGVAAAHASLESTLPANGEVLTVAPTTVTMTFSENVEVAFSVFGVHRLDAEVDLEADNAQLRLNGLAGPLVKGWLDDPEADGSLLATTSEPSAGPAAEVTLTFAEPPSAGHYVVVWRVISADTHPVEGYFLFSVTDGD